MTVVINAVGVKLGGGGTVLRALAAEWARQPAGHRFVFYVSPEQADPGFSLPAHIEWQPAAAGAGALGRLWWDQVALRRRLREHRADVLLSFSDFGVLGCPAPQLLVVQNSLYFSDLFQRRILPEKGWRYSLSYRLRRWLVCRSIRTADAVMTPSASLREMLRRTVAVPDGKLGVNPYGTAPRPAGGEPPRDYSGAIRLLFPTYYADHKGFSTALEALRRLRQRHGPRFRLVTTADPLWPPARVTATWKRDAARLEELRREDAVEVVGLLPYEELLALYAACHVMCYPTLTESFGQPLVEAMAAGLPVAASDIPVNRELARDAALYFDPLDPAALADRVEEIVADSALRAGLQERGRRYAREFSWSRHTNELLRRLEELAGRRHEA